RKKIFVGQDGSCAPVAYRRKGGRVYPAPAVGELPTRRRLPTCPTTHQKEIHMRLAVVFLFLTAFVHAQSFQGSLRGRIADPNGAVVPMAKITVTDEGTSSSRASI